MSLCVLFCFLRVCLCTILLHSLRLNILNEPVVFGYDPNKWYQSDGRLVRRHVQTYRLQLLSVEVEDERHARVQRPLVAGAVRR